MRGELWQRSSVYTTKSPDSKLSTQKIVALLFLIIREIRIPQIRVIEENKGKKYCNSISFSREGESEIIALKLASSKNFSFLAQSITLMIGDWMVFFKMSKK